MRLLHKGTYLQDNCLGELCLCGKRRERCRAEVGCGSRDLLVSERTLPSVSPPPLLLSLLSSCYLDLLFAFCILFQNKTRQPLGCLICPAPFSCLGVLNIRKPTTHRLSLTPVPPPERNRLQSSYQASRTRPFLVASVNTATAATLQTSRGCNTSSSALIFQLPWLDMDPNGLAVNLTRSGSP